MARYHATLETDGEPTELFAYLSDFSNTREWDPGVVEAERLDELPIGEDSKFRLVAEFLGRQSTLTYRVVEFDPPRAVTFLGENATVVSNDRISLEAIERGTRITYDAELTLKGPLRLADALLGLAFKRVGDRALAGLRRTLTATSSEVLRPLRARSLDGRDLELPDDLDQPFNLLVVAFRREQQAVVDGWLPWLTGLEEKRSDVAVYEVPVLPASYAPLRWMIDGGMNRGIPDPAARARTLTSYTDVDEVVANLGLSGPDTIAILVVGPTGRILACEQGDFERAKAERIATVLAPAPAGAGSDT